MSSYSGDDQGQQLCPSQLFVVWPPRWPGELLSRHMLGFRGASRPGRDQLSCLPSDPPPGASSQPHARPPSRRGNTLSRGGRGAWPVLAVSPDTTVDEVHASDGCWKFRFELFHGPEWNFNTSSWVGLTHILRYPIISYLGYYLGS